MADLPSKEIAKVTTLKLTRDTKERLECLRVYRRETSDEILRKIIDILNTCRLEPERARMRLLMIDQERKRNLYPEEKEEKQKKKAEKKILKSVY